MREEILNAVRKEGHKLEDCETCSNRQLLFVCFLRPPVPKTQMTHRQWTLSLSRAPPWNHSLVHRQHLSLSPLLTLGHATTKLGRDGPQTARQFELSLSSSAVSVIEEARKELNRDREAVSRILAQEKEKRDGAEEGESDGEDRDGDLEDSESDTDTEDKEDSEPQEEYGLELAELNSEINIKQKLIDELEQSQRRLHVMKQQYEDKLQQLMARIKNTQEERDKVLASYGELYTV
uniref:Uncharacterized protein n=1 Tax=Timema tahoe TaxID=61484 RepID=A0A7R9IMT9_9NEOP|nr:unnamed protein product [Timema tahoe]